MLDCGASAQMPPAAVTARLRTFRRVQLPIGKSRAAGVGPFEDFQPGGSPFGRPQERAHLCPSARCLIRSERFAEFTPGCQDWQRIAGDWRPSPRRLRMVAVGRCGERHFAEPLNVPVPLRDMSVTSLVPSSVSGDQGVSAIAGTVSGQEYRSHSHRCSAPLSGGGVFGRVRSGGARWVLVAGGLLFVLLNSGCAGGSSCPGPDQRMAEPGVTPQTAAQPRAGDSLVGGSSKEGAAGGRSTFEDFGFEGPAGAAQAAGAKKSSVAGSAAGGAVGVRVRPEPIPTLRRIGGSEARPVPTPPDQAPVSPSGSN